MGEFLEGGSYPGSGEGVKSLYGLPTEEQLNALEWAKEFMNAYERKRDRKKINESIE